MVDLLELMDVFKKIEDIAPIDSDVARSLALALDEEYSPSVLLHAATADVEVHQEKLWDSEFTLRQKRMEARKLAEKEAQSTYAFMKIVKKPLFHAQALAHVARYSDEDRVVSIATESMRAFCESPDMYERVAGAAWPIRVLIERGFLQEARNMLDEALEMAPLIVRNVQLADALFHLWEATASVKEFADEMIEMVVAACENTYSWRGPMLLKRVLLKYSQISPERAWTFINQMPESKEKREVIQACNLIKNDGPDAPAAIAS